MCAGREHRKDSTESSWFWAHATDNLRHEELKLSTGITGSGGEKKRMKQMWVGDIQS